MQEKSENEYIYTDESDKDFTEKERTHFIVKIFSGDRVSKDISIKLINELSLTDLPIQYKELKNPSILVSLIVFFEKIKAWHRITEVNDIIVDLDETTDSSILYEFMNGDEGGKITDIYVPRIKRFLKKISKKEARKILFGKKALELVQKYKMKKYLIKILNNIPPFTNGEKVIYKRLMNEDEPVILELLSDYILSSFEKDNLDRFFKERGKYKFCQETKESDGVSIDAKSKEVFQGSMFNRELSKDDDSYSDKETSDSENIADREALVLGAAFKGVKIYDDGTGEKPFSTHYFNDDGEEIYHFGNTLEDVIANYIGSPVENIKWSEEELNELSKLEEFKVSQD